MALNIEGVVDRSLDREEALGRPSGLFATALKPFAAVVFVQRLCHPKSRGGYSSEAGYMYLIIRKFGGMRTVREAARRAESGIGQLMKESPGFLGYYIFDAGGGVGGSITLFDTEEAATAANEKALAWIQASLTDLIEGEPEIVAGEVLAAVMP